MTQSPTTPVLSTDSEQGIVPSHTFVKGSESHEMVQLDGAELEVSRFKFDEIEIITFRGQVHQKTTLPIQDSGEYVSLAFVKNGTITTISNQCDYHHVAKPNTANLCSHHQFKGIAQFEPTKDLQIVSICVTKNYLTEFNTLLEHCDVAKANGYMHISMNNNVPMQNCIDLLLNPPVSGSIKQVFLKGKAYELIALSIQSLFSQPLETGNIENKTRKRVEHAQHILNQSLSSPPKLFELAKMVGTNDCQLKKDFKAVLNTSPYAYVIRRRMESGYQMITTMNHSITDIAQSLGYNNPSHFSSTFYKHFGVKPKDLKHSRKA